MFQTIIKDIREIHTATILQILDLTENISSIFLLPRPGFEPAFLYRWCRRRLLIVQRLIRMASLASFLLLWQASFLMMMLMELLYVVRDRDQSKVMKM